MSSGILFVHKNKVLRSKARKALESIGFEFHESSQITTKSLWNISFYPCVVLFPYEDKETLQSTLSLCKQIESDKNQKISTIVICNKKNINAAIISIEVGTDDWIKDTFDSDELIVRVRSLINKEHKLTPNAISVGPITLDYEVHGIFINEELVHFSPGEFRLMEFFLQNEKRVLSRDELLQNVWPANIQAGTRTVDVKIRRVRRVLEQFNYDHMLQTVRGKGYRFTAFGRRLRSVAQRNDTHAQIN
jgi:two-component system phosphate regulon response regulator PhoB